MAEIKEARGVRGPRKKLKHMLVMKGKGGGHIVEHHYEQAAGEYHEHESKPFGEGQGEEMLAHVGKHMGVKSEQGEQQEEAKSVEPGEPEPERSGE